MLKTLKLAGLLGMLGPALFTPDAEACSCLVRPMEVAFAQSDVVVLATPVDEHLSGDSRVYEARVDFAFRGNLRRGNSIFLTTPLSSAACGMNFQLGKLYVIHANNATGNPSASTVHARTFSTGLCSQNAQWESMNFEARAFLYGRVHCHDDGACGPHALCAYPDASSTRVCRPYAFEGEYCGGFTTPERSTECAENLQCVYGDPTGDVPGLCLRQCSASLPCAAGQHCRDAHCSPVQQPH